MANNIDISTAILAINPDAQVTVNAEDYNQITWYAGTVVISKADIQAINKQNYKLLMMLNNIKEIEK